MAYEGWLSFGGNEVVNSERTRGLAETSDCPPTWFRGERCETLQDALGDEAYTHDNVGLAPWFDASLPSLSERFFGVYGLSFSGIRDSTRSASSTEGIDDGGTLGSVRKGMRSVRVRGTLMAQGLDALEYGVSWLNAALDPGACGQHGTECGTTDLEYLTDCPPARGEVPDFTPWVQSRRNEIVNPAPAVATGWARIGATFDFSSGHLVAKSTYSGTSSTTPRAQVVNAAGATPVTPGDPYYLRMEVKHSRGVPMEVRPWFMLADGTPVTYHVSPTASAPSDWTPIETSGTVPATAVLMGYQVFVKSNLDAAVVGDVFEVRNITTDEGDYFSGATEPTELRRYSWAGAANASASIEEVRSPATRPRTDEEYAALVDPMRRFLHDVKVTSGPLEVDIFESKRSKGIWGATYEWTITSERPWVYSKTRLTALPTTSTTVVEDTPYNLAPYPSAELTTTGPITVSRNYSLNPSLETNATGWVNNSTGTGTITAGRITGELAAAGTASFRVVHTATAAGQAAVLRVHQDVGIGAVPAGARISASIWAAEILTAGTATRDEIVGKLHWLDSGGAELDSVDLGSAEVNGGTLSASSLQIPAGAVTARVGIEAQISNTSAAASTRLYVDALAVTVP